ncbi:alpha/beta fold hydrolase [Rubrobacter marinus]|uniref:Alpha/beta fold hydrolase n=2 Tax=Rubrobacter marinus TaxID=2653852 RepID=A0A6G8Q2C6_9ACTN|nr:alpha/beta fold hydrolase [Rubrobacter marinus]
MLHGFPDFWYTWRHQMAGLAGAGYRVAAADLRGYNLSDAPQGAGSYGMRALLGDVSAVIRAEGRQGATVVGHDWGGAIAWQFATRVPEMIGALAVLNLPHLSGLTRELAENPEQYEASAYTRRFQEEGAHEELDAVTLARWVSDSEARPRYVEAFERSDFEAMLFYYKRHYPREPYRAAGPPEARVGCPVLQIHGLEDPYLLPGALNGTWEWVDGVLTLVTVPGAGHFVQQDAADLVTRRILAWLPR